MPTDPFTISSGANDGKCEGSSASYPPAYVYHDTTDVLANAARVFGGGIYYVDQALFRWDTSPLPDGAIVTGAEASIHVFNVYNVDARQVVADWRVMDGTSADYSPTAISNAFSGVALASVPVGANYIFTLDNAPANVSLTGMTGLRFHISGTAPTGQNQCQFDTYESGNPAVLTVFYTLATSRIAPDAILSQTNLTGSVSFIQDDPDSPDANWLTAP